MGPAGFCVCESTRRPAGHGTPQVLASGIAIPAPSAVSVSDDAVYFVSREDRAGAAGDTIVKRIPLGVAAGLTGSGSDGYCRS